MHVVINDFYCNDVCWNELGHSLLGGDVKEVSEHDILFIGSSVYAHHLQYHVKDLIKKLPQPVHGWGKIAVPFVTYGGISSGIALEE